MTSAQRLMLAGGALALLGALFLFFRSPSAPQRGGPPPSPAAQLTTAPASAPATPRASGAQTAATADNQSSPLADALGAPTATIQQDLRLLQEVLLAWHTNFPGTGYPEGDNAEITRALTGANRLGFAFLRRQHPAINARGELCDRWGTPFFFHALSGTRMELRSAGPDRTLYTDDDAVLTPP